MGCDMVVALGPATVGGTTLFGHNLHGPTSQDLMLCNAPGRQFCPGEVLTLGKLQLPQARQTYAVLGCRSADAWGFHYGINEHRVSAGAAAWQSKLDKPEAGLTGPDLVRLALERCRSARQALDLMTDLIARHGQTASPEPGDNVFLLADCTEAYVLEGAGSYWAWAQCSERRAVSDVGLVRQDWQRLSPGLAECAIAHGWWPDDGSKLDFGSLCANPLGERWGLRRWGRAALLLEQQTGHIDLAFVRRLLSDHYEGTPFECDPAEPAASPTPLCQHHSRQNGGEATLVSFLTQLQPEAHSVPILWCAFGPPCLSVYIPLLPDAELPETYENIRADLWHPRRLAALLAQQPQRWPAWREVLSQLQARIDQETEDFAAEARDLRARGDNDALRRQASLFMQNHLEQLEAAFQRLCIQGPRRAVLNSIAALEN